MILIDLSMVDMSHFSVEYAKKLLMSHTSAMDAGNSIAAGASMLRKRRGKGAIRALISVPQAKLLPYSVRPC